MAPRRKKGGHWCSATNCRNSRLKRPGLSFFRFPAEKERCSRWVENSCREDLRSHDSTSLHSCYYMCAEHFEPDMFMDVNKRNKLIWSAVPTIFDRTESPGKMCTKRKLSVENGSLPAKGKPLLLQNCNFEEHIEHEDNSKTLSSNNLPNLDDHHTNSVLTTSQDNTS